MQVFTALAPLIGWVMKFLVIRIIVALGMTIVTYAGYIISLREFKSYVNRAMQSMPSDILNLLLMAGVGEGLGYLFGAFAFAVSIRTINRLTFQPAK